MDKFIPSSFIQVIGGVFSFLALVSFLASFRKSIRPHSVRLFAIALISAVTLFANNSWVYFVSVFIIATAVTETEFLQNFVAIIRGDRHYFDYKKAVYGKGFSSGVSELPETTDSAQVESKQE
ncbi:MAG: hypothetical protein HY209_03400 [Candidatus Omnitrophica bacterium]|nr:hypothetical protein [Candidatus Omnitrophota bacterium]